VIMPTVSQLEESDLDIVVAGTADNIIMVEGGCREVPEADMIAALEFAQSHIRRIVVAQNELVARSGKPKRPLLAPPDVTALRSDLETYRGRLRDALRIPGKEPRQEEIDRIVDEAKGALKERYAEQEAFIGKILHESAISRFARTLALTFKAGVPLVEALETVGGATGSVVYSDAVKQIRDDVSVGYQLNLAMKQVNLFPHMVVSMVAIGEESGALDAMLFKVAEFYEEEVNNAVDSLSSLLEPFIMVIIGVLVGSMVIGMYLPIFKLAAAI